MHRLQSNSDVRRLVLLQLLCWLTKAVGWGSASAVTRSFLSCIAHAGSSSCGMPITGGNYSFPPHTIMSLESRFLLLSRLMGFLVILTKSIQQWFAHAFCQFGTRVDHRSLSRTIISLATRGDHRSLYLTITSLATRGDHRSLSHTITSLGTRGRHRSLAHKITSLGSGLFLFRSV